MRASNEGKRVLEGVRPAKGRPWYHPARALLANSTFLHYARRTAAEEQRCSQRQHERFPGTGCLLVGL